MNSQKSISGFLDIDSEKHLYKRDNEPMPEALENAKPGDKFKVELIGVVSSTELNTNSKKIDRVQLSFESLSLVSGV
jgi:hypothetical protein